MFVSESTHSYTIPFKLPDTHTHTGIFRDAHTCIHPVGYFHLTPQMLASVRLIKFILLLYSE